MKQVLVTLSLVFSLSSLVFFTACGDDSSTSVNDDESSSSTKTVILSSSEGSSNSSSSAKSNGSSDGKKVSSSSSKIVVASSSSRKTDGGSEAAMTSSSSKKVALSSSGKASSSSWSEAIGSSNSKPSSSSQKSDLGTSSGMTSSSKKAVASSSSEYVPFDHSKTHANASKVGKDAYKQFTDPRNGRSYYYIKIIGKNSSKDKDSVTIMAENLNIGDMVLGKDDQNDDTKIERYCYNNDTTLCDEFGGLYQWAEMMQLPSRCNTESCSDLIEQNHQGICPDGWRLMTYDDFYIAWHAETNSYGIEGVRSAYLFNGYNSSGLSLTGSGMRKAEGEFADLRNVAYWFYPEEHEYDVTAFTHAAYVASAENVAGTSRNQRSEKVVGKSVRCVKLE